MQQEGVLTLYIYLQVNKYVHWVNDKIQNSSWMLNQTKKNPENTLKINV